MSEAFGKLMDSFNQFKLQKPGYKAVAVSLAAEALIKQCIPPSIFVAKSDSPVSSFMGVEIYSLAEIPFQEAIAFQSRSACRVFVETVEKLRNNGQYESARLYVQAMLNISKTEKVGT